MFTCSSLAMIAVERADAHALSLYTLATIRAGIVTITQALRTTRTSVILVTLTSLPRIRLDAVSMSTTCYILTYLFGTVRISPTRLARTNSRALVACSLIATSRTRLVLAHHQRTVLESFRTRTYSLLTSSSVQTISRTRQNSSSTIQT